MTDKDGLLDGEHEIWRNGQWRVTNMVLEEVPGGSGYWISKDDLSRSGWVEHMAEKNWVDIDAFKEAYLKACEIHGVDVPPPPKKGDQNAVYTPDIHDADWLKGQ